MAIPIHDLWWLAAGGSAGYGARFMKAPASSLRIQPLYALGQRGAVMPPRVAYAIVRALVPGGVTRLMTRQAARIIRGSTPTVREGSAV
jgi:hypothetical protein